MHKIYPARLQLHPHPVHAIQMVVLSSPVRRRHHKGNMVVHIVVLLELLRENVNLVQLLHQIICLPHQIIMVLHLHLHLVLLLFGLLLYLLKLLVGNHPRLHLNQGHHLPYVVFTRNRDSIHLSGQQGEILHEL